MHITSHWQKTGALCFTLGGVVYLLAEKISALAWHHPAYSYLHNYISDLGIATCGVTPDGRDICSPAHHIMNTGFAAEGVLFFIACGLLRSLFDSPGRGLFLLFGLLHGVGGVLIALFHSGTGTGGITLHQAGAVMAIGGGNLCLIIAGWLQRHRWPRFAILSMTLGAVGLISMITISLDILPVGFIERLSVYTITFWQIVTGLVLAFNARTGNSPVR